MNTTANDQERAEALPASPCVRRCCLDPATDVCTGCFRSLEEIMGWYKADAEERRAVLRRTEARRRMRDDPAAC